MAVLLLVKSRIARRRRDLDALCGWRSGLVGRLFGRFLGAGISDDRRSVEGGHGLGHGLGHRFRDRLGHRIRARAVRDPADVADMVAVLATDTVALGRLGD